MKNATLRQLKVFEAVARLSSFSRAAEELHLSQPAVSIQVRKLAEHADAPLFEQLGKKVYLTAAGSELLHHSRIIIGQFEEAAAAMTLVKGTVGGELNVAVISAGDSFLPRLLVAFVAEHARVKLNLSVLNRAALLQQLAENRVDLAVMGRPPVGADTLNEAFAPHPYVVVAAAGHALCSERGISQARIARERFIVREKGSDNWQTLTEGFGRHAAALNIGMQIQSTETIKQAVLAGMGISFLSMHVVAPELRTGSLVVLDVKGFPLQLQWHVVQRRSKRLPPVAQAFRAFLLKDGARLIAEAMAGPAPAAKLRRAARSVPAPQPARAPSRR
ncbi:MAG: LysR family transcriptional regulator [Pseudomonadota bacterium]|nr:LysR family transcriptional regulator [Pseudomonadota bacterium]